MIYVIATIQLAEGQRDPFLEAFRANVPNVLAEDGCLMYVPTVDVATEIDAQPDVRPDAVTVVESWRDVDALEAHLAAPHMVSFREQVASMVKDVQLQILEPSK